MVFTQEEIKAFVDRHESKYRFRCVLESEGEPRRYFGINLSDILTELIQTTGRFCLCYASDLFIEWEAVLKSIDKRDFGIRLIGMRENGVDETDCVMANYADPRPNYNYYRALYALELSDDSDQLPGYIKVKLTRLDP